MLQKGIDTSRAAICQIMTKTDIFTVWLYVTSPLVAPKAERNGMDCGRVFHVQIVTLAMKPTIQGLMPAETARGLSRTKKTEVTSVWEMTRSLMR